MACELNNKEINSQCAELLVRPTYISYQVEMVCSQSTNQFIGSITTVAQHVGVSILPQLFCHVASS